MSEEALSIDGHFPLPPPEEGYHQWIDAATKALKGKPLGKIKPKGWEPIEREALYTASHPPPATAPRPLAPATHAQRRDHGWEIRALHAGATHHSNAIDIAAQQSATSVWLANTSRDDLPKFSAQTSTLGLQLHVDTDALNQPNDAQLSLFQAPHVAGLYVDPLGRWASEGHISADWNEVWQHTASLVQTAAKAAHHPKTLAISGLRYLEAGAHASQEIASILAQLVETLRQLENVEISPETSMAQVSIRVGIGRHQFTEIAKFRALRRCLGKLLNACKLTSTPHIHGCTALATTTQRDPWVNLLRASAACFSAAIGGADAISLHPFDSALTNESSTLAQRQAINIQHVLAKESHLHRVIDPAGGSWYVEHMTEQLARDAWQWFQEIEAAGGLQRALTTGMIQDRLADNRAAIETDVAKRKAPLLGVSEYANPTEQLPTTPKQASSLAEPTGEGSCRPLGTYRWAASWEALRDASDAYANAHGQRPQVFFLNLGTIPEHKARAGFAARFFEAGGFACITNDGFQDVNEAAAAFAASGAVGAVICSTDARYAQADGVGALAPLLQSPAFVVVAGKMGEHSEAWRAAGVTHEIYLGCPALPLLQEFQRAAGVTS